jgi:hypothetical protein
LRVPLFDKSKEADEAPDMNVDCPNYDLKEAYLKIKVKLN